MWETIDTRTGEIFALGEVKRYTVNTSKYFSKFRITISDINGDTSYFDFTELEMYGVNFIEYADFIGVQNAIGKFEFTNISSPDNDADKISNLEFDDNLDDSVGDLVFQPINTPTYVPGIFGNAINFIKSQYLRMADLNYTVPTDNCTYSFWFKRDSSIDISTRMLLYTGKTGDGVEEENEFSIRYSQTNSEIYIFTETGAGDNFTNLFASNTIIDDNWHHIVVKMNGANTSLFLDGVEFPCTSNGGVFVPTTGLGKVVKIGSNSDNSASSNYCVAGSLDRYTIYNRPLSNDEIDSIYKSGNIGNKLLSYEKIKNGDKLVIVKDDYSINEIVASGVNENIFDVFHPDMDSYSQEEFNITITPGTEKSGYYAYNAFNSNTNYLETSTVVSDVTIEYPNPILIHTEYQIKCDIDYTAPYSWTIQCSMTGEFAGEETIVATEFQTNMTGHDSYHTFSIDIDTVAKFVRISVTEGRQPGYFRIEDIVYNARSTVYSIDLADIVHGEIVDRVFRVDENMLFNDVEASMLSNTYTYSESTGDKLLSSDRTFNEVLFSENLEIVTKAQMSATGNKMTQLDFDVMRNPIENTISIASINETSTGSCEYEEGLECNAQSEYTVLQDGGVYFNWTITGGTLISGQGTDTVIIETSGSADLVFDVKCDVSNDLNSDTITQQFTHTRIEKAPTALIMEYETTTDNKLVYLPTVTGFNYDATIDWGDGNTSQITAYATGRDHTYVTAGRYTVRVEGLFECISMNNITNCKDTLVNISNIGSTGLKSMKYLLYGATKFESINFADGNYSLLESVETMHLEEPTVGITGFEDIDFSKVTKANELFHTNGIAIDLAKINFDSLADASYLFYNCDSVFTNKIVLGLATTSLYRVVYRTNIDIDLSLCDLSNVTNLEFACGGIGPSITIDFGNNTCPSATSLTGFLQIGDGTIIVPDGFAPNITSARQMFYGAKATLNVDFTKFNLSKVTDFYRFLYQSYYNPDMTGFTNSVATNMEGFMDYAYFTGAIDLSGFNTSNVTIFKNCFSNSKASSITGIGTWDVSNASDISFFGYLASASDIMYDNLVFKDGANVEGLTNLKYGSIDLTNMDFSKVSKAGSLLRDATDSNVTGIDTLRLNAATNVSNFLYYANLTTIDLSNIQLDNVTNLISMVGRATIGTITFPPNLFDKVNTASNMLIASTIDTVDFTGSPFVLPISIGGFANDSNIKHIIFDQTNTVELVYCRQAFDDTDLVDFNIDCFDLSGANLDVYKFISLKDPNVVLPSLGIDHFQFASDGYKYNFIDGLALSQSEYDKALIYWDGLATINTGVNIRMPQALYTAGGAAEAAKQRLIDNHGWIFDDGGGV